MPRDQPKTARNNIAIKDEGGGGSGGGPGQARRWWAEGVVDLPGCQQMGYPLPLPGNSTVAVKVQESQRDLLLSVDLAREVNYQAGAAV